VKREAGREPEIGGLNRAQREAVEHPPEDGPLIVLAGPGTGKTRVITRRIAHLIQDRGIAPESIAAVTFTNKAAAQLRERLSRLVGFATASRVHAHSFHAFGARLLTQYGDRLDLAPMTAGSRSLQRGRSGRLRRSELIDSAQSRRMLRKLILDEDLFGHARAGGLEAIIDEALRLFDYFDNHALGNDQIEAFVSRWAKAIERGESSDGSPLPAEDRAASIRSERDRLDRFVAFARLRALHDCERRGSGLMTYGDQMVLPIRLLRDHPALAARIRTEIKHWLVDEFQDVNAAQIELLRLVAPPESGRPDLCVVGDDDQAIFGFRGADDRAFDKFSALWQGTRVVELTENYRSRPRVIALCNSVIGRATERFAPDKKIESPANADPDPPGVVQCVHLRDDKEDGETIAALIRLDGAAAAFDRYAVVARTHGDLNRIEEALWLEGVPTVRARSGAATDEPGVMDLMAWSRLLARPRDAWHARRVLLRPPLSIPVEQVNAWDQQYRGAVSRWHAARDGWGGSSSVSQVGGEAARDPGAFALWLGRTAADEPLAAKFVAWFELFSRVATEESAAGLLATIVRETGVVNADLAGERDRSRRVESVVKLLNFVQSRQSRLPAPGGIREFLDYYDDLSSNEQGLGESSSEPDDAAEEDCDRPSAVTLLTAHVAKGLEFDTVFVPRVTPQYGYPQTRVRHELDVPAGLCEDEAAGRPLQARQMAEERRTFYVACTRAERRLVLLARQNKAASSSTHYLEEILSDESVRGIVEVVSVADVLAQAARTMDAARGQDALRGLRTPAGESAVASCGVHDRRRELLERARREARLAAAAALGRVDVSSADAEALDRAGADLRDAADRMAAIAAVETSGRPPKWSARWPEPSRRTIEELARLVGAPAEKLAKGQPSAWATKRLAPPLALSYTTIDCYLKCPRCYYIKYALKFEGPEGKPAALGLAMHKTLERFYQEFSEADAVGTPAPDLERMVALARDEFFLNTAADREIDRGELDKMIAQARLTFERLHEQDVHVLETEWKIEFDYVSAGLAKKKSKKAESGAEADPSPAPVPTMHRMNVKLDRIDQVTLPDGRAGFRIVDYKTGHASKRHSSPETDDLQMGIYTLALRHEFGAEAAGWAEYWLLATGERGRIDLEQIDEARVRAVIDRVVAGILAGHFEKGKDCDGQVCGVLGPLD